MKTESVGYDSQWLNIAADYFQVQSPRLFDQMTCEMVVTHAVMLTWQWLIGSLDKLDLRRSRTLVRKHVVVRRPEGGCLTRCGQP